MRLQPAGEGGNSTSQILAQLDALPDCAHYALLAGTNDNNLADAAAVPAGAGRTAANLESIVVWLLARAATRRVFLGSILPCHSNDPALKPNPPRDQANQYFVDRHSPPSPGELLIPSPTRGH